jgi:hypothetical protein
MHACELLRQLNPAAFWAGVTAFLWYAFAGIPLHLAVAAQLDPDRLAD